MAEAPQPKGSPDDPRCSTEGNRFTKTQELAYKIAIEGWHAECERFWKAFATIMTLNAGLFVVVGLKNLSVDSDIAIAILGIAICITWLSLQRGYAGWVDRWEEIVIEYEAPFAPVFRDRRVTGRGRSTKKTAGFFPVLVTLGWIIILVTALVVKLTAEG